MAQPIQLGVRAEHWEVGGSKRDKKRVKCLKKEGGKAEFERGNG